MLSVSNLLCGHNAGNERLRYGHVRGSFNGDELDDPIRRAPRPVVVWNLTKACNLRCVHCYASADARPAPGELDFLEGIKVLDDLKEFGIPAVLFSGGEPLYRADTLDLIAYARSIDLAVTLSTNGILIDDKTADRLAEAGLKYAGISLDGTRERHDKLRGMKGAYEGSVEAIRRCRDRGIRVGVRFTVHALNRWELDSIFDVCADNDVQRLCVYHLAYAGRGGKMQKVDLTTEQTRDVVTRIFERTREFHERGIPLEVLTVGNHSDAAYMILETEKEDPGRAAEIWEALSGTGGNRSGCNIACIDPVGNVHYDQFSWHYTCGNVRVEPFSKIWSEAADERLAILRNRADHLPLKCKACRFLPICNGNLRTRAEAATGDWLGADPSCYISDAERLPL